MDSRKKMKTGVYYNNKDLRVEEKPVPEIGNKEILIKVMACGICGSDVLEWYRIKKAPLVLGHELAGEVVKAGKGSAFKAGDRVFATHHVPCGECWYCKNSHETSCEVFHGENNFAPGGFSQFLRVSGRSLKTGVFKLPKNMSYEMGTFIEPLGTVVRGQRTAGTMKGDTVLIIGSGITGILHIMLAKELGATNIIATDINEYRMAAAKKAGANFVINAKQDVPSEVKKVNNGRPADKVIICAGALPAAEQAVNSVDKGGTILFFAVPLPGEKVAIDFTPFWRNDISIKTSYGAAPQDNEEAIKLISSGKIKATGIITHRLPLDKISEGFSLAAAGKECLKVIIKPND
jgi:L-iditol 2-dehydrogenase